MSKRAPGHKRNQGDFYQTHSLRAVTPLRPHVRRGMRYIEPCAGDGVLIGHLASLGLRLIDAYDLDPKCAWIARRDALTHVPPQTDFSFITNPPWSRDVLHPLIEHLSDIAPTWLLYDADWLHNVASGPFSDRLRKIVSVGRVKWIPDSKHSGKDNAAWFLFDRPRPGNRPRFYMRGGG